MQKLFVFRSFVGRIKKIYFTVPQVLVTGHRNAIERETYVKLTSTIIRLNQSLFYTVHVFVKLISHNLSF